MGVSLLKKYQLTEMIRVMLTCTDWEAGVNDALSLVVMEAHPSAGDQYSQEIAIGFAQDIAQVLRVNNALTISLGSFDDLQLTKEWSPQDKGVTEHKNYAPGVGFIYGITVKGGSENTESAKITGSRARMARHSGAFAVAGLGPDATRRLESVSLLGVRRRMQPLVGLPLQHGRQLLPASPLRLW
jgi:hypothetical protein